MFRPASFAQLKSIAAELPGLLESLKAREVIVPAEAPRLLPVNARAAQKRWVTTEQEDWIFTPDYADRILREHFKLHLARWLRAGGNRPAAVAAAGAVLHYLRDTQRAALDHLDPPTYFDRADNMVLDAVTVRNLELLEPIFSDGGATLIARSGSDRDGHGRTTVAAAPAAAFARSARRSKRGWMRSAIWCGRRSCARSLRKQLAPVLDMERLLAKVMIGSAGPREVLALGRSLEADAAAG